MDIKGEVVTELIIDTAKRIVAEMPEEHRFELNGESELFGNTSGFDSIGLMSFLIELEETVEEKFGRRISLADNRALSESEVPFRNVSLLSKFIEKSLKLL